MDAGYVVYLLPHSFRLPSQGYPAGCEAKNQWRDGGGVSQSLVQQATRGGTVMFHYKFKSSAFPGRGSGTSR